MQTLLIINDHVQLQEVIAEVFEIEGFRVLKARTGIEGLGLALRERPSIIICDLAMGGLGSYAVYDVLQSDPRTASIPFILMTGWRNAPDAVTWRPIPNERIIAKPFHVEQLISVIAQIVRPAAIA